MTKTAQQHTSETDQIVRHLKEGDALVLKLRDELIIARGALEWLTVFSHPKFVAQPTYQLRAGKGDGVVSMKSVIDDRVSAINALLGDRA